MNCLKFNRLTGFRSLLLLYVTYSLCSCEPIGDKKLLVTQNDINSIESLGDDLSVDEFKKGIFFSRGKDFNRDSAIFYFKRALSLGKKLGNTSVEGRSLYKLGINNTNRDSIDLALNYLWTLKSKSISLNNIYLENLSYSGLGLTHHWGSSLDSALYYYKKAYYKCAKPDFSESDSFYCAATLVSCYLDMGNFTEALPIIMDNMKLINNKDINYVTQAFFYTLLAELHRGKGDYQKAIYFYKKALKIANKHKDISSAYLPLVNLGSINVAIDNHYEAKNYLLRANSIANELGYGDGVMDTSLHLGLCYKSFGNYDLAREYFSRALMHSKNNNYALSRGRILKEMATLNSNPSDSYENMMGQHRNNLQVLKKSSKFLIEGIAEQKKKRDYSKVMEGYFDLYKVDSLLGNLDSSFKNYQNFVKYQDSLFNRQNRILIDELEFTNRYSEKMIELERVKFEKEKLDKNFLREKRFRFILALLSLILAILLTLLINGYQLKKKSLKIIKTQSLQNEILLKEIQHRVKNNLQIIVSMINRQVMGFSQQVTTDSFDNSNVQIMDILVELRVKIKSIASIHEHLFINIDNKNVVSSSFFSTMIENIKVGYDINDIDFVTNIEPHHFQSDIATIFGLIAHELIVNAIKHAFNNSESARNLLEINFKVVKENNKNKGCLRVSDNGVGITNLPEVTGKNFSEDNSGLNLVLGLLSQVDGDVEFDSTDKGLQVLISVSLQM